MKSIIFIHQKNLLKTTAVILAAIALSSCGTSRRLASTQQTDDNPKFLKNSAWIKPHGRNSSTTTDNNNYPAKEPGKKTSNAATTNVSDDYNTLSLQNKYAGILSVNTSDIGNMNLYKLIDNWWGTPYLYGGTNISGIDCSAFSQMLEQNIYSKNLPRTSEQQYEQSELIRKEDLQEGDLVFFHTLKGNYITHVGIYLTNNKFVHASSSNGVIISDLTDAYWQKTYRAAGRVGK